jgi:hypothetical protein
VVLNLDVEGRGHSVAVPRQSFDEVGFLTGAEPSGPNLRIEFWYILGDRAQKRHVGPNCVSKSGWIQSILRGGEKRAVPRLHPLATEMRSDFDASRNYASFPRCQRANHGGDPVGWYANVVVNAEKNFVAGCGESGVTRVGETGCFLLD